LIFGKEVATYIRGRTWHASQELRERRDGRLELRLETSGRKELSQWIISWMPHVKVLAPRQHRLIWGGAGEVIRRRDSF